MSGSPPLGTYAQALRDRAREPEPYRLEQALVVWRQVLRRRHGRVLASTIVWHATIVTGCQRALGGAA